MPGTRSSPRAGTPFGRCACTASPAAAAALVPLALVGLVVAAPLAQLGVWSVESIREDLLPPEFGAAVRNSLLLAGMSAVLVPVAALLLAYGARASRSRLAAGAARTATIGYGLPGSVVAVAVIVPLGWIDRRIDGAFGTGLLLTGTVIGLFYAYLVRFLALAWGAVEASLLRIPRQLDDAARGLGADRLDVLARVHVPLLVPGLAHRGPARVRGGDEGAARHAAPAPARRRHARDRGLAGHERVAVPRPRRCPRS